MDAWTADGEEAMNAQTSLDFNIHLVETTQAQCRIILDRLLDGQVITLADALRMGISTLSQRVGELRRGKFDGKEYPILSCRVVDKNYNQYWMDSRFWKLTERESDESNGYL